MIAAPEAFTNTPLVTYRFELTGPLKLDSVIVPLFVNPFAIARFPAQQKAFPLMYNTEPVAVVSAPFR